MADQALKMKEFVDVSNWETMLPNMLNWRAQKFFQTEVDLAEGQTLILSTAPSFADVAMHQKDPNTVNVVDLDGPISSFPGMIEAMLSIGGGVTFNEICPEWQTLMDLDADVKDRTLIASTRPDNDEKIEITGPESLYRRIFQDFWNGGVGLNIANELKKGGFMNFFHTNDRREHDGVLFRKSVENILSKYPDATNIKFFVDALTIDSIGRDIKTLVAALDGKPKHDRLETTAVRTILEVAKELGMDIHKIELVLTNRMLFKEQKGIIQTQGEIKGSSVIEP